MEDFVHDYYSVEKFQKAYEGRVEQLRDKFYWPKVSKSVVCKRSVFTNWEKRCRPPKEE
jgi:hypothetical protein